jgi:hypothetical protein
MKFTFKTIKPTGRYKSFDNELHQIKLKGFEVGTINSEKPHRIRLMVIKDDINSDGNPNCTWKWITLDKSFSNVQEAKSYLNKVKDLVLDKYNLYYIND